MDHTDENLEKDTEAQQIIHAIQKSPCIDHSNIQPKQRRTTRTLEIERQLSCSLDRIAHVFARFAVQSCEHDLALVRIAKLSESTEWSD
jgi:hypothetical protein